MTPFEMALELMVVGRPVPAYPEPLVPDKVLQDSAFQSEIQAAYLHLCDAWEWQVMCLYAAELGKSLTYPPDLSHPAGYRPRDV